MKDRIRRIGHIGFPVLVGVVGAWLGLTLWSGTTERMGPFEVRLETRIGPGETSIELPPMGSVVADTHTAPLRLEASLRDLDLQALSDRLSNGSIRELATEVEEDAFARLAPYALRALGVAAGGALLLGLLAFRKDPRRVGAAALTAVVLVGGSQLAAWQTFRPSGFRQPTFNGTIALAPQLVGSVEEVTDRIEDFRAELRKVVSGAVRAYTALEPAILEAGNEIRVLHVSDIHLSPLGLDFAQQIAQSFDVDLVLDTGDLTSYGTPVEEAVVGELRRFGRPYVFVRGNHDPEPIADAVRGLEGTTVLDGTVAEVEGLRVYGLPHPVYTEDKTQDEESGTFEERARAAGGEIAADLRRLAEVPDIVAVHDDRMAEAVAGDVPLVVSGHYHESSRWFRNDTMYLRAGSASGAGVNAFVPGEGAPLSVQVLYFERDPDPRLVAYDVIEQELDSASLTVRRHLVEDERRRRTPGRDGPIMLPAPTPEPGRVPVP